MSSIPEKINALVKAHKAIIFSKTTCPYCTNAKRAFAAVGVAPHVIELDSDPACSEWQAALSKLTGASTSVPKVFVNGAFLGGGDDTVAAHKSGQLAKLCKEAGLL
jgi:glutaredoxin 3